jgi:PAS domain S-box-containing protein
VLAALCLLAPTGANAAAPIQGLGRAATFTFQQREISAVVAALALLEAMLIGALWVNSSRRRRAELALRTSETRHRALLKVIPDLMFVLSRDGQYLDYHAKNLGDLFVPPEQFLGKNMREIMPPALDARFREGFAEAVATGEPVLVEYALPLGGEEKHFEARVLHEEVGFVSIVRDITERKRVAEQLRKSEEFNRRIIENSPECVKILDPDGTLTYMSPAGMQMLELDEFIIKGRNILEFLGGRDKKAGMEALARARAGGIGTFHGMVRTRFGREKWFDAVVSPMLDANGKVESLLAISRDVTERRAAEDALRDTQAQLARVSRAMTLGALTSTIAHEVSQPLAAVLLNARACQRLLDGGPANLPAARDCIDEMERNARHASEIITRVRTLVTKAPAQHNRLDVNEVIGDVLALVRDDVASAGVVLFTELESDLPSVEGDRVQLQQVLLNLIRNGIEAMLDNGELPRRLVIRSRRATGHSVEVEVRDSGLGLAPGDEERIFDAFYTTKTDGTGLGLAMSRSIVDAHGGRLWAATNPDGGATFRFVLGGAPVSAPLLATAFASSTQPIAPRP